MSYLTYVIAAYVVFAVVLGWDYIAPRLQIRQQLRAAKLRVVRRRDVPVRDLESQLSRE